MSLYHRQDRLWAFIAAAGDAFVALGSYLLSFWLRSQTTLGLFDQPLPHDRFSVVPHYLVFLALLQIGIFYFFRFYESDTLHRPLKALQRLCTASVLQVLILIAYYFFRQPAGLAFPRTVFILFLLINTLLLLGWRALLKAAVLGDAPRPRVLIVGANCAAEDLIREIRRLPHSRLEVVGIVLGPGDPSCTDVAGLPVLGRYRQTAEIARHTHADEVIVASTHTWQEELLEDFIRDGGTLCRISVLPTSYEILLGRISRLRIYDIPLIELRREPDAPWERFLKRCLDLSVAIIALAVLLPVSLAVALAVKFTSPGPVIYKQTRVGRHGKEFNILKFRTMIADAERIVGPVLAGVNDPRITKVGRFLRKTRLDEIPQLINVLRGEMSLVGPRPERPHFVAQFCESFPVYRERLVVKPGLTGLAQVNGAYDTSAENKLKYDLAYIYNQSLWLDLLILLETVKVVLAGEGEPTRDTDMSFLVEQLPHGQSSPPREE